jgi:hypothetical protein
MSNFPTDIYTEPSNLDVDTLRNLGPLRAMAGIWTGARGLDVKPKAEGPKKQAYTERYELQPIDPQTNGPQLFYGLRYHQHVVKPEQVKTYHDQVGYWLWERAGRDRRLTHQRHRLDGVPRARIQDRRIPHQSDRQCRRHVVIRRGHGDDDQGTRRAVPSHRPRHAHEGRGTDSESAGARGSRAGAFSRMTKYMSIAPLPFASTFPRYSHSKRERMRS